MASLGELFIELGIFADTKELEAVEKKLNNFVKTGDKALKKAKENTQANKEFAEAVKGGLKALAGAAAAITAAGVALNKLTNDLVSSNQAMLDLTRTTDIAQSTFQKWGGIGKMLGVENADQQLASLNERLFELRLTGQGARGFQLAGINPMGQDANGVMEQIRGRIQGMDDTSASYLLRQMGLDPKMLHLLRMGREEFEALGATIRKYQLTPEQSKQIQQMNIQLQIANIQMQYFKNRAILALMPYWVKFMQSLTRVTELLAKAGKNVGQFVVKWRSLVVGFAVAISKLKPIQTFFTGISAAISGLITKIPVFGRALAKLGPVFSKAFLPLTAAYLLLDDLAGYMQGADSLTGRVVEWAQTGGSEIGEAFKKMFGGDFWGGMGDLGQILVEKLTDIALSITKIIDILLGTKISKPAKEGVNFLQELVKVKDKAEFDKLMQQAPNWIKKVDEFNDEFFDNLRQPFLSWGLKGMNNTTNTNTDNSIVVTSYITSNNPVFDIQQQMNTARFSQVSALG